jgi:hypothetical protein
VAPKTLTEISENNKTVISVHINTCINPLAEENIYIYIYIYTHITFLEPCHGVLVLSALKCITLRVLKSMGYR